MRLLLLISLFSLLLVAGCAQQGYLNNQTANQTGNKTTMADAKTIKVGVLLPLTGSLANIGAGMKDSLTMAAEDINKNGSMNGKTLELVFEDTSCDSAKAIPAINKMITQDHISALVGGTCSGESLAIAPILTQNKLPAISPSATNPDITTKGGDYLYRVAPSDSFQAKVAEKYAREKLGSKKVAVLYQNDDWGVGLKDAFIATFKANGGQVVGGEDNSFEKGTTDVRTQIAEIKSANPDLIYVPCFPAECSVILTQLSEAGYTGNILGADGADDAATLAKLGKVADGLKITVPSGPSDSFNAKFKARFNKDGGAYTAQAYDSLVLLSEGLKKGSDTQSVKQYLDDLLSYVGQSGIITFDDNGDITSARYDIKEFRDGKFTLIEKVSV
jgi:branched-chain amino acid transport system substrate-binding protein